MDRRGSRRALVIGAGIGGLAVARLLRDADFEVEVLERSRHLTLRGAGIILWPNATRILRRLGLDSDLLKSPAMSHLRLHRWDGQVLVSTDLSELEQRYGAPMLCVQRTTLLNALLRGGVRNLVRTGTEVASAAETPSGAVAMATGGERFEADVLIGADGVRSAVRASLLADGSPIPTGILAYRGVIDALPFEIGMGEYWGAGKVFGIVPVDNNRLFWLATKRRTFHEPAEPNPIPGLLERHCDWAPEIGQVIKATKPEEVMRHELFDRKPQQRWVGERIALLGDAAHPMLPFLGQGACQALEDAFVLSRLLGSAASVPAALDGYQRNRQRRAARITLKSRRMTQIAHIRGAALRIARDHALPLIPKRIRTYRTDQIINGPY